MSGSNAVVKRRSAAPAHPKAFDAEVDIVVVGSGAGGLSAALFARWLGDEVIVLEKASEIGGTTRKAAFWYWVPNNAAMRKQGLTDSKNDCVRYMARLSRPETYDPDHPTFGMGAWDYSMCEAIYDNASPAAELLAAKGALEYRHCPDVPDYWCELPEDKAPKGRVLLPKGACDTMSDGGEVAVRTMSETARRDGVVPLLMRRFDSRLLVVVGLVIFSASCFMNLYLNSDYGGPQLFAPDVTRAFGQALAMTPLSAIAMVGITQDEAGAASGLFNMLRNLGGAIGTAAVETFFTKREQYHSFIINAHVSQLEPATRTRLATLQEYFMAHGVSDPAGATHRAVIAIGETIRAQATVMGYADCFGLLGAVLVFAVASLALLKKGTTATGGAH